MRIEGAQRFAVAMLILACTAALAWATMDAGRIRDVTLLLLGASALRVTLARRKDH